MIDIGIPARSAKWNQLIRLLHTSHIIRMSVQVCTLGGEYTKDLSSLLMSGQVNIDTTQQVTRAADLTIFDPFKKIQLDPDDPSKISTGMSDLIKIVYIVIDPETKDAFNIPIFCGPVDSVSRDATSLKITAVGKESLAIGNSYVGKIFKKNAKKTDVIKWILANIIGENKYQIPDLAAKLPADWRLSQGDIPWDACVKLARGMGYQLFYDGRGVARMRKPGGKSLFTFDDNWVSSSPSISYDATQVVNVVVVKGGKPKKAKTNVGYTAIAPASHPLSPQRLGRNGVPRYLFGSAIEDSSLISTAECKATATANLNRGLVLGFNAQWTGLPMPLLEESDMVSIDSGGLKATIALNTFAIPLTIGPSTYGYTRSLKPRGGQRGISSKQYNQYNTKRRAWASAIRKDDARKAKAAAAKKKRQAAAAKKRKKAKKK